MGKMGEFGNCVIWNRLGITKRIPRVYEISGTEPVKTILLAAFLE